MAIVESRVKDGELKLGTTPGTDFSCQVTNIRINSSYDDDGDALETLCGDTVPPGRKLGSRALAGTFVQDWTAAEATSLTKYLYAHDLEVVDFVYTPNVEGDTISGQVRIEVPSETWGGDVNARITSDFEWFMIGEPTFTPPVVGFTDLESMTVAELQALATEAGLPTSGTKAELIERLNEPVGAPA